VFACVTSTAVGVVLGCCLLGLVSAGVVWIRTRPGVIRRAGSRRPPARERDRQVGLGWGQLVLSPHALSCVAAASVRELAACVLRPLPFCCALLASTEMRGPREMLRARWCWTMICGPHVMFWRGWGQAAGQQGWVRAPRVLRVVPSRQVSTQHDRLARHCSSLNPRIDPINLK
jgi:hypothetical protein